MGSRSILSVIVIYLASFQPLTSCLPLSSGEKETPSALSHDSEVSQVSIPDWKVDDTIDSAEKAVLEDMARMAAMAAMADEDGVRSEMRKADDHGESRRLRTSEESGGSSRQRSFHHHHGMGLWGHWRKGHRHHHHSGESGSSEMDRSDSSHGDTSEDWSGRSSEEESGSSSGSSEECFCGSNTDFAKDLRRFLNRLKHKYRYLMAKPLFAMILNIEFWDRACLFFRDVIMKSVH